jgi:hypothetical protein
MISDINATDFTISENELDRVFTGSGEIEKFHYNKANYHDITNPFLLDYLMIDK